MNKKAIVVYLDDTKRCLEEFSWLYKTWALWEIYSEYDLVVYHNPSIKEGIPKHDKIILRGMEPLNKTEEFWEKYPFVNSFSMFLKTEESDFIKSKYDFVLKTECDVFLTKYILGKEPERLMTGRGGYMRPEKADEVLLNISRVQKELKLNNFNLNHIGSSVFGKTEDIIKIVNLQYSITEHLLKNEWKESDGIWPGWSKGVASMYGIHMAVNNHFHDQNTILYSLDSICWESKLDSDTFHIHAWHYTGDFSKHKWFKGEYKKPKFNRIPTIVSDYCLLIVSHTIEELIRIKENDPDKFSVIISTEWKSKNIDKLLKDLNNSDLVSQIVLIDTSKEDRDEKLISLSKVKYVIQDKKLNDSLLRNLGVKESKNELLCFCQDNINFNVDEIFGWVLRNSGGLGCVGIHPDSLKSDREVIDVVKNYYDSSVWKNLIFLNKNNWVDVPKISGDNGWEYWIMKTHTPYYSVKTKTKIENELTQLEKGFNNLLSNDFQNHEKL